MIGAFLVSTQQDLLGKAEGLSDPTCGLTKVVVVCIWPFMLACGDSDTHLRTCVPKRLRSKWALITEWGISAGNILCYLVDNTWRAGILDKDLMCQTAMELFLMPIEIDSPHKSSVLMCVCCLVADNENAGRVLLKTTQTE